MANQRAVTTIKITGDGPSIAHKWSGQPATFFFSGTFSSASVAVQISLTGDKDDWFDPSENIFTEKSVRTLVFGAGEYIRTFTTGSAGGVDILCRFCGETTSGRG